jgi:hypothetical protein
MNTLRASKPRTCIYTAIYGGYDRLKPQPAQTIPVDFICFTDDDRIEAVSPWRVVCRRRPESHPRMQAKFYKVLSHVAFEPPARRWGLSWLRPNRQRTAYDFAIWIDGSVQVKTPDFAATMLSSIGRYGWAMFVHPNWDNLHEEVACLEGMPRFKGIPFRPQVDAYFAEGCPATGIHPHMATGVIARDMRVVALVDVNKRWWDEHLRWTYRDQVSLPYVLWKLNYGYDPIRLNMWQNHLFDVLAHRIDR